LSADTKLHVLFDETRHEGKNIMNYEVPHFDTALEADATLSDMSVSEEEDVHYSYSDQDEADRSRDAETEGKKGDGDDLQS
jgi:hypothetical protein